MLLDRLLSLVAPPLCWDCGAAARIGEPLCRACRGRLRWLGTGPVEAAGLRTWAPVAYEGPARSLVRALKFRGAVEVAEAMAAMVVAGAPRQLMEGATLVPGAAASCEAADPRLQPGGAPGRRRRSSRRAGVRAVPGARRGRDPSGGSPARHADGGRPRDRGRSPRRRRAGQRPARRRRDHHGVDIGRLCVRPSRRRLWRAGGPGLRSNARPLTWRSAHTGTTIRFTRDSDPRRAACASRSRGATCRWGMT